MVKVQHIVSGRIQNVAPSMARILIKLNKAKMYVEPAAAEISEALKAGKISPNEARESSGLKPLPEPVMETAPAPAPDPIVEATEAAPIDPPLFAVSEPVKAADPVPAAAEPAPTPAAPAVDADAEPKPKRKYTRRDMTAEKSEG